MTPVVHTKAVVKTCTYSVGVGWRVRLGHGRNSGVGGGRNVAWDLVHGAKRGGHYIENMVGGEDTTEAG